MQAPGGVLREVRLGVVGQVGDLDAGSEGAAVPLAHHECVGLGAREQEQARRAAGQARVVGVADVHRRRPARGVVERAGAGAHLRVARGVGEDRHERARGGQGDRTVVGMVGREDRLARAGRAPVERDVLDGEAGGLGVGGHRQRVARPADGLVERRDPDRVTRVEGRPAVGRGELPDLVEARARQAVAVGDDAHRRAVDGDERTAERRARGGDRRAHVAGAGAARQPAEVQRGGVGLRPEPRDVGRAGRVDRDAGLVPGADRQGSPRPPARRAPARRRGTRSRGQGSAPGAS